MNSNLLKKLAGYAVIVATCGMLTSCYVDSGRRPYYARWHRPVVYVVR